MANAIKIGNNSISSIKIGTADVDAVYIGSTLVYSPIQAEFTTATVDSNFLNLTPVYGIHIDWASNDDNNESFGFSDNSSFSQSGGYNCNIEYDENSGLYELTISKYPDWSTPVYSHSYSSNTEMDIDFIELFGKPMYFENPPSEEGQCIDEVCVSEVCPPGCDYCVEYDEVTGDCLLSECGCPTECMEYMCVNHEQLYYVTAKIIQQN